MACGRTLLNKQDGFSISRVLSVLVENVKKQNNDYDILTAHKEILFDFDNNSKIHFVATVVSAYCQTL